MAAFVTIADAILAFPIAYYMARVASPRTRNLLVVAILMPLWASYLVKAYAWRTILSDGGVINWALEPFGLHFDGLSTVGLWLVFTYLWLPFMILPIYAGLERIPTRCSRRRQTSAGARCTTFTRVILPLAFPAIVAGSIFTFCLTLGDYIAPGLSRASSSSERSSTTSAARRCPRRLRTRSCRSSSSSPTCSWRESCGPSSRLRAR